jgi:hypothetical protein
MVALCANKCAMIILVYSVLHASQQTLAPKWLREVSSISRFTDIELASLCSILKSINYFGSVSEDHTWFKMLCSYNDSILYPDIEDALAKGQAQPFLHPN